MSKIQAIAEAATLGAISIGANIVTGTQNVVDTILGGDALPQVVEASSASAIPSPDTISTVMNIITQLAILLTTFWRLVKKDKPKTDTSK